MTQTATAVDITMPQLSDSMEEGTIIAWLVDDGATVAAGVDLVEIETDKATMTYEAEAAGVLHIVTAVGDTVPVGAVIARIGDGDVPPLPPVESSETNAAAPEPEADSDVRASPVARRIAAHHEVSLDGLTGTGPRGRIVRADVERAAGIAEHKGQAHSPSPAPRDGGAKGEVATEQLTRLQQTVARRMAESKATQPEFVIGVDVDMEEAIALRERLKQLAGREKPPSYNDFVVKACAMALREYPRANASYREGRFELYGRINVGVAVAANDALVVPTIIDADRKSLGEIGRETRALADKVREGTITPPELSGGTFTVSNLGMFGIAEFIAVINPPQAAILSVGEMRRQPVEHEGEIALRHVMKVKLTCDHRILYGADAAGFLARIRELLQSPLVMGL